jgi:hypothetical protein
MVTLVAAWGTSAAPPATAEPRVETVDGLKVVFLEGSAYDMGRQHAKLLGNDVERTIVTVLSYFRSYLKIPWIGGLAVDWWLDRSWGASMPHLATDSLEELQGLSDGSGVPLKELWRMHAVPDRTYACANFAAWGRATDGGRMLHLRNLDWNIGAGVQQHPAVFVVQPKGKRAFVSAGWAGFIGVLTGVNERGVSIGQVGAETADVDYRGVPMPFLMRRVMEESDGLDEAVQIITAGPRTVGINYVIADAPARRAVTIETTRTFAVVFEADDVKEHAIDYARPVPDCVFRADTAIDRAVRERQLASGGQPTRAGLEPPTGSAYSTRYLGQAAGLLAYYGTLDVARAQEVARAIAPDSNVQSVVIAWPELYVANARGTDKAAAQPYVRIEAGRLLRQGRLSQLEWEPLAPEDDIPLMRWD